MLVENKIVSEGDVLKNWDDFIERIRKGDVIIYPTDTIYGVGCNALNEGSVRRIRELKRREEKPFSVIVPDKGWIRKNCRLREHENFLKMLPGPYTFVFELKDYGVVDYEVNRGSGTLGIRIPDHWISRAVSEAGVPFVTTSVNISQEQELRDIRTLEKGFVGGVDYVVNAGILAGKGSTVYDLSGKKVIILRK